MLAAPLPVRPALAALLLCETVIIEANTGTNTLVRVSDRIAIAAFPTERPLSVYVKITDAEGAYTLRLVYREGATQRVIDSLELGTIHAVDRLRYYDAVLPIILSISGVGTYFLGLTANGEYLGETRLEILARPH
jgi:hypothetical protein